jgi:hypothetical protein
MVAIIWAANVAAARAVNVLSAADSFPEVGTAGDDNQVVS